MFMMLNPSTADADIDDNTIRRCIGFAKLWGYGGLMVGNLFAFRSTKPDLLLQQGNPIGPHNDHYLTEMVKQAEIIVLAWGNADIVNRIAKLYPNYKPLNLLPLEKLYCLRLGSEATGSHPVHPLYQKTTTPLIKLNLQSKNNKLCLQTS